MDRSAAGVSTMSQNRSDSPGGQPRPTRLDADDTQPPSQARGPQVATGSLTREQPVAGELLGDALAPLLADPAEGGVGDHPAAASDGHTGFCVHHVERAPGDDDLLYQQNHHGVWRSDDGGRGWRNITAGLPSTFGFPLAVHPRDPRTIWTLPLNGDMEGRYPPEAAAAVWRSRDGGSTWEAQRTGLPQQSCYFTVLRQAMSGDHCDPAGLYFGTNTGSVFASRDEGQTWDEIARHLPTVLAVEVLQTARD